MPNNSQGKKQQVEDHRRSFKFSKNKTSVTVCNDSLNAKTLNVNFICVTCGKCVLNDNHDMCVLHYINGINSRTKQLYVVLISNREPKRTMNQSVTTSLKKTVASASTNQKPRSTIRKQYEHISNKCKWWYPKFTPSGYKWKPKSPIGNVNINVSMPLGNESRTANVLEHMTPRCSTMSNTPLSSNSFTARRDNSIHRRLWVLKAHDWKSQASKVYYMEGLNNNLFSVGQFCDADLEVAFRKSTCYIRDLKGNDLLTGSRGTDMYSITLQDTSTPNPIFLMAKATSSQTCWTHFLRSKDETPEVLIDFLRLVQRGLHAQVRTVRTDKGTKFLNKTLHAYFAQEGIEHQTSVARTPEQNGVVKRRNHTLVDAARTMLSAAKVPLNGENLDKMKEKGDAFIFVGYFTQSRAYRVYNKRTRVIIETIHVNFDELPQMASNHFSFEPAPQCPTTALEHDSLSPGPQSQKNVPQAAETVTMSNELNLLFSPMFDELLNRTTLFVSKSSVVNVVDAPNKRQQQNTTSSTSTTIAANIPPLNTQTTPTTTSQAPTQAPTVTATENIYQAET
ncbi:integrase, catalytic region, zinc finger, CCHC-type containing protein [Tanacetum coccineum]|uniref:Integrase, catalytic region, zinc finger, CCHC-type containing protein n=1 Tax=Tanacetum coccineum TaxID=301880 RepID=A0ABQ4YXI8_9ASTR